LTTTGPILATPVGPSNVMAGHLLLLGRQQGPNHVVGFSGRL